MTSAAGGANAKSPWRRSYSISRYPAPAGGCLLTDPGFALRIKELLRHQERPSRSDLELLKWGRHFRLPDGAKAVVGRTQRDNEGICGWRSAGDHCLNVEDYPSPLVLVRGGASEADLQTAAGLAAAYSDAPLGVPVRVSLEADASCRTIHLTVPPKDRFKNLLI